MAQLRFDGQVAIVTGSGGGLGREYALALAKRGAAVVVNDLGGTRSGEGASSMAADKVVQEIRAFGGKACPDYNSVEDGEKIVETALKNFGHIDILINNAGILRDKSFMKMTIEDWDLIHRVHLRGSFIVTRAAWPHFKKQGYGRIIMTSSGAGVFGNFGQANYSSAKLGLVGLSNTLAIEGQKYDIHCNVIVPIAASRLTQDILPPELFEQMKPELVAPVVVWLCHRDCPENGGIFEAAGGWVGKYQWQRSLGKAFIPVSQLVPENIKEDWDKITDMANALSPSSLQEQTGLLMEALSGGGGKTGEADGEGSSIYKYNNDSVILYALAIGVSTAENDHLKFLYEGSEDFSVIPTFGTIPGLMALLGSRELQEEMYKLNADPSKILHGEQYLELFEPLSPEDTLYSTCKVVDVLDKRSGALIIADVISHNAKGKKIMYNQFSSFLVGAGNFGGKRSSPKLKEIVTPPSSPPHTVVTEKTSIDQAALYRLCGDKNPLHIDPTFAQMGGFSKPILHGLCSLGFAMRHVLKNYANNDVTKFKALKVRFSGPIIPGEVIRTEMWQDGNRIYFQTLNATQNKPILSGGYMDFLDIAVHREVPISVAPPIPDSAKSNIIFEEMRKRLKEMPEITSKIQVIYQWNITKGGKLATQWTTDLKSGAIYNGPSKSPPDVTLILDDDDMLALVEGQLDPQKAFMTGRLKLKGNIMLAQKLQSLFAARAAPAELHCHKIFQEMESAIKSKPDLAKKIGAIYLFNITKDGRQAAQYTVDLQIPGGSVYQGAPKQGKPDGTFTLDDDILTDIHAGRADPQKAFLKGNLQVSGNLFAAQKFLELMKLRESDPAASSQPFAGEPSRLKSDHVFQAFADRIPEEPELAKKVKVIYYWRILKDGQIVTDWTVDLKTGEGQIYKGPPKGVKSDVVMTIDDEDFVKLMMGKLNPQRAFMTGRLKIKGNIMLTQKLNQLWQEILKSGRAVELPFFSPILIDRSFNPDLACEPYLLEMAKKLSRTKNIKTMFDRVFEWNIVKNGTPMSQLTLDLKSSQPSIKFGKVKNLPPDCIIHIEDETVVDLVTGKLPGPKLLEHPTVKVEGDKAAFQKLIGLVTPSAKL